MSNTRRERQREQRRINRLQEEKPCKVSDDWKAVTSVYVTLKTIKSFCDKEKQNNERDNQLLRPRNGRYFGIDFEVNTPNNLPAKCK